MSSTGRQATRWLTSNYNMTRTSLTTNFCCGWLSSNQQAVDEVLAAGPDSYDYPARDKLVLELTSRKDIASISIQKGREISPSPSAERPGLHAKHSLRASQWLPGGCAVVA